MDFLELQYSDPVVICPYDESHQIARSRIQSHIVKCEKNHPPGYKEICPYNASHRVFKDELAHHLKHCPQKKLIEPELNQHVKNHGCQMTEFMAKSDLGSMIDHGESWDNEIEKDSVSINGKPSLTNDSNINKLFHQGYLGTTRKLVNDTPGNPLRAPRGFSEAMMVDGGFGTEVLDMDSVISVMAIGRGRAKPGNMQQYRRLMIGKERPMTYQ
ncbi:uncharacterized protein LOC105690298 isoform X1 [Athalia rosae]|uniref:uncharacterized protein LOC105690298 isoform X1 n=1 Tax=Athalia rosae TaxID=37344 RepID=UPI0020339093|nr:uncharacterized protein LOC105690298 isoform X1 [Athalia rosae]